MKLILTILHEDDGPGVMSQLNKQGFTVTKLATTGGFLRAGNMTLLVGTSEQNVDTVIDIIKSKSETRKHMIDSSMPSPGMAGGYGTNLVEVALGGATVFVLDVERFEKL